MKCVTKPKAPKLMPGALTTLSCYTEFFYLPDFLVNVNGLDLGKSQKTGRRIDDVRLPPWVCAAEKPFSPNYDSDPHLNR